MPSFILENVSVPAGGRAGHRQAVEHGGGRQPERLREVPDGAGLREGRLGRRRHRRRDGGRHGDGAADAQPARRVRRADDAGRGRRAAGRRRRPSRDAEARRGREGARRDRGRRRRQPRGRRPEGQAHRHAVAHHARPALRSSSSSVGRETPPHPRPADGARQVSLPGLRRRGQLEPGEAGARLPVLRHRIAGDARAARAPAR